MIISRHEDESDEEYAKRVQSIQKSGAFPPPPDGWTSLFADEDKDDANS